MSRRLRYVLSGRLLPCALLLLFLFAGSALLALWLPRALAPVAAAERLFSLGAALFLLNARLPAERKNTGLFLLLLLPWIGAVFCLAARPSERAPVSPSRPFGDGLMDAVSSIAKGGCGLAGCYAESAEYFATGEEMEGPFLADLAAAKEEILLDYYLLARGEFFGNVLSVLTQKAQTGVEITLIYDDFGCAATLPKRFAEELGKRGIKASVYHPVAPFPVGRLNCRDHRKIAVIDGKIAYTGGINLADEYVGRQIRFGHWKDTAVRLTGEPAARFRALFPDGAKEETDREREGTDRTGIPCAVFADGERRLGTGEEVILAAIRAAREKIYLFTPYLAPTERVFCALVSAARAGVDVRLMIPHIPDKKAVFRLTRSEARRLADAGVGVREYTAGFLHAKSLVLDGEYSLIGSYNLDRRSLVLQRECGVFLKDRELAAHIERDFLSCFEAGTPLPAAKAGDRILCPFLRLLAPLI